MKHDELNAGYRIATNGGIMKKVIITGLVLLISGCFTTTPVSTTHIGREAEELVQAADAHKEGTEAVISDATHIYKESKEEDSVKRAGNIIDNTTKLKALEEIVREEAVSKKNYIKQLDELTARNTQLEEEIDSGNAKKYVWLRMIGALLIALGIGGAVFMRDPSMLAIAVSGVALAASTFLFNFIEDYIGWIGFAVLGIIIFFVVRIYLVHKNTVKGAVGFGEILKQRLRATGDIEFLKELTGDDVIPGKLPPKSKSAERIIKAVRKQIGKEAKPVIPRVSTEKRKK